MSTDKKALRRADFRQLSQIHTRWEDHDTYGHVNNVVYYSYFDTAVNRHLIQQGVLDLKSSPVIGLVIESQCTYFASLTFPDVITVGLRVIHLGNSSVRYQIGLFANDSDTVAAVGEFVHVYVDRESNRPVAIPAATRAVLAQMVV